MKEEKPSAIGWYIVMFGVFILLPVLKMISAYLQWGDSQRIILDKSNWQYTVRCVVCTLSFNKGE